MTSATADSVPLVLENLTAGYKGADVLRGVNVRVPSGSVIALLGPNGAGKTTMLRCASGLLRTRSGRLKVGGQDVTGLPSHRVAQAGVCHIPEGRGIYPSLSVRENILMFSPYLPPAELLDSTLSAFPHLKRKLGQAAGTLSGGEQQMLALGRALMLSPKILLVDEPSVGLAPILVSRTIDAIAEMKSRYALTVLMAEQNFNQAIRIAERGYVIVHGRIAFEGRSADELNNNDLIKKFYLGL